MSARPAIHRSFRPSIPAGNQTRWPALSDDRFAYTIAGIGGSRSLSIAPDGRLQIVTVQSFFSVLMNAIVEFYGSSCPWGQLCSNVFQNILPKWHDSVCITWFRCSCKKRSLFLMILVLELEFMFQLKCFWTWTAKILCSIVMEYHKHLCTT